MCIRDSIEGDPEHPINEGSLCAKGAGIYQTTEANDRRLKKVLYRAPYGDKWEEKDWDFAIDRIARHLKEERDAGFVKKNAKGQTVNRVESVAHLGSSNVDSEECWSMAVFARSYGLVYIDHPVSYTPLDVSKRQRQGRTDHDAVWRASCSLGRGGSV